MDKIVGIIAAGGIPYVMLLVAMSMTGLSGAAAITAGLALLGPGGMIGGVITLAVAGSIAAALTDYGFDVLFRAVIKKLYEKGETKSSIKMKIEKGYYSKRLKDRALSELEKL